MEPATEEAGKCDEANQATVHQCQELERAPQCAGAVGAVGPQHSTVHLEPVPAASDAPTSSEKHEHVLIQQGSSPLLWHTKITRPKKPRRKT